METILHLTQWDVYRITKLTQQGWQFIPYANMWRKTNMTHTYTVNKPCGCCTGEENTTDFTLDEAWEHEDDVG